MTAEGADWRTTHAEPWARTVLRVLSTAYPYATQHVVEGPDRTDADPLRMHPAFWGSFDWHSSVHMHWSAVRLLTLAPDLTAPTRDALVALLDERLVPDAVRVEADHLRSHPTWERPYGWAWAAALAAATTACPLPQAARWSRALDPLADAVEDALLGWLPRLAQPVRHGVHGNTAFALALVHESSVRRGRDDVVSAVEEAARGWFSEDRNYPAAWEPSGSDFLSPALCEADLLRRVLPAEAFGPWLTAFLPDLGRAGDPLLDVPEVGDHADGQAVHLVGLALSRAWQLRLLAPHLPAGRRRRVAEATARQTAAAAEETVSGNFMATHWLVSFALLAATASEV